MRSLPFVLLVVALHLGVAAMAASRQLLAAPATLVPWVACDPAR